ncbi:ABC transporter permease [Bordetella sp. FB-8]|uniref:ABC transporter permease n=1 Tax=Bordetella sp. FB-8 TaxID=1159870 RepID=UPI00037E34BE|nr:ABC transporter permease [Bordetella sp. FB-8]
MFEPIQIIYRYRHMLYATTRNEIRARYVGSVLGAAWAVIYPFFYLGLYACIYTLVFRVRLNGHTSFEYVLMIFAGLIPFIGFSEALSASTTAVISNKGLIKNTVFPIELLPIKSVLSSSVSMAVGLIGLLIAYAAVGEGSLLDVLIIPIFVMQLLFCIGLAWLISSLTVFFRDIAQMIGIVIQFLMLVSPIGYTLDMIPKSLLPIMYPNPLFYIIEIYRQILFFHQIPWKSIAAFSLMTIVIFYLGHFVFSRLKPVFGEYV